MKTLLCVMPLAIALAATAPGVQAATSADQRCLMPCPQQVQTRPAGAGLVRTADAQRRIQRMQMRQLRAIQAYENRQRRAERRDELREERIRLREERMKLREERHALRQERRNFRRGQY